MPADNHSDEGRQSKENDTLREKSEATQLGDVNENNGEKAKQNAKLSSSGVELVPQPSDDPRDPLNWPMSKKITIFGIMCFGTFVGIASAVANVLATPVQAKDWGVDPQVAAYSVSAVLGGITVGPVILVAAVRVFGVMSCCFWSEVIVVATSIWSAFCTGPGGFNSFVASRVVSGLVTGTVQVFSTGVIAQIFFLHQRGKALAVYSTLYIISAVAGPTFSGYIVQYVSWPVCFWWAVAGNALAAILFFLFGDDTTWDRTNNRPMSAHELPHSWFGKRFVLFFPGSKVVAPGKMNNIKTSYNNLFRIAFSPVTVVAGSFTLISYAWFIMAGVQVPIILEAPPPMGYGFSPLATSNFYFSAWIGALLGVGYGILLNDRLPLLIQKKRNGIWHPEFRLHTAWFPHLIVTPIGVGVFGAAVFYKPHYMILAVAETMVVFGATATITPPVNYVIEIFKSHPQEVGTALNVYRIAFTVAIQFFYQPWILAAGINWAWGTAAFISIAGGGFIALLVWKGATLRKHSLLTDEAAADEAAAHARVMNGDT